MPNDASQTSQKKSNRRGDPTVPVTISLTRAMRALLDEKAGRLQRSRYIAETLAERFRADAAQSAPSH